MKRITVIRCVKHLVLLLSILIVSAQSRPPKVKDDFISINSTKVGTVDKKQGTLFFEENVNVIQESTGSTLTSDRLFAKRDNQTTKLLQAKAEGQVHVVINKKDEVTQAIRTVDIKCRLAEYDRLLNKALLRGSIVAKSHDFHLTADQIYYDLEKESGTVTELPGKQVLMTVVKNATSTSNAITDTNFIPEIIEGSADEIRIYKLLRKITFQGRVRFHDHTEQAIFTGGRADAYFSQDEKLERIIAYNKVTITQPKRFSSADRAVFDYRADTVQLTGNAAVKEQDQMEIRSSSLTMYMNENLGIISGDEKVPIKAKVKIAP